ncbi:MAG TPA: hypothetical protein VG756_24665 [Pseudonocardiaceae bacterium]|nr:hypothetical protein [Pseudonocardiaceae bacterium]
MLASTPRRGRCLFAAAEPVVRTALIGLVRLETWLPDASCAHAELVTALANGDAAAAVAATLANLGPVTEGVRNAITEGPDILDTATERGTRS